jgi:hypothetical protein
VAIGELVVESSATPEQVTAICDSLLLPHGFERAGKSGEIKYQKKYVWYSQASLNFKILPGLNGYKIEYWHGSTGISFIKYKPDSKNVSMKQRGELDRMIELLSNGITNIQINDLATSNLSPTKTQPLINEVSQKTNQPDVESSTQHISSSTQPLIIDDSQLSWDGSKWVSTQQNYPSDFNQAPTQPIASVVQPTQFEPSIQSPLVANDPSSLLSRVRQSGLHSISALSAFLFLILILYLISFAFDSRDEDRIVYDPNSGQDMWVDDEGDLSPLSEKPYDKVDYYLLMFKIVIVPWTLLGVFLWYKGQPIKDFKRLRKMSPDDSSLYSGDSFRLMYDGSRIIWAIPIVIVVIIGFILWFSTKIAMKQQQEH